MTIPLLDGRHDWGCDADRGVLGTGAWGRTLSGFVEQQGHRCSAASPHASNVDRASLAKGQDLIILCLAMPVVLARSPAGAGLAGWSAAVEWHKGIDLEQTNHASQVWQQEPAEYCAVWCWSGPKSGHRGSRAYRAASVLASSHAALAAEPQVSSVVIRFASTPTAILMGTELAGA